MFRNEFGINPKLVKLERNLVRGFGFVFLASAFFLSGAGQSLAGRAGLVMRHGDGRVITRCVSFSGGSISGADLLRRSGLQTSIRGSGSQQAVYQIDGEGDPNGWVFVGGKCYYWAYYHLGGSSWQYSNVGAGAYQVGDGGVEGWAWAARGSEVLPPLVAFDQICQSSSSSSVSSRATPQAPASATGSSGSPASSSNSGVSENNAGEDESGNLSETPTRSADKNKKDSSGKKKAKKEKTKSNSFWSSLIGNNGYWRKYVIFLGIVIFLVLMILFIKIRKSRLDQ